MCFLVTYDYKYRLTVKLNTKLYEAEEIDGFVNYVKIVVVSYVKSSFYVIVPKVIFANGSLHFV